MKQDSLQHIPLAHTNHPYLTSYSRPAWCAKASALLTPTFLAADLLPECLAEMKLASYKSGILDTRVRVYFDLYA